MENDFQVWQEKLVFLRAEEATAVDPATKFAIRKNIEECEVRLQGLSSSIKSAVSGKRNVTQIEITIKRDFNSFTEADQRKFTRALAELCGIEEGIEIIERRSGSVILRTNLSPDDAERLLDAALKGTLDSLSIGEVTIRGDEPITSALQTVGGGRRPQKEDASDSSQRTKRATAELSKLLNQLGSVRDVVEMYMDSPGITVLEATQQLGIDERQLGLRRAVAAFKLMACSNDADLTSWCEEVLNRENSLDRAVVYRLILFTILLTCVPNLPAAQRAAAHIHYTNMLVNENERRTQTEIAAELGIQQSTYYQNLGQAEENISRMVKESAFLQSVYSAWRDECES